MSAGQDLTRNLARYRAGDDSMTRTNDHTGSGFSGVSCRGLIADEISSQKSISNGIYHNHTSEAT